MTIFKPVLKESKVRMKEIKQSVVTSTILVAYAHIHTYTHTH